MSDSALLSVLIFLAAVLYSSVGHGGGSGYLAAMALLGVAPGVMKPAALSLNILVASIGTIRFYRAGCFSWRVFLPFALGSVPLAYVGGAVALPGNLYKQIVGAILLIAAARLILRPGATRTPPTARTRAPSTQRMLAVLAVVCGSGIGLLAGLTGTGGGIFLTPLLLLTGWAETREAAGISAAFILVNSIAGLFGQLATVPALPPGLPFWALAAVAGGLIGSELGSRRLGSLTLRRLLGAMLVVAGLKLFFL